MSTQQATLHDFHEPAAFKTVEFDKTVVFLLHTPTKRKRQRLDFAIAEAHHVTTTASDRMPSVPKTRWRKKHTQTWNGWSSDTATKPNSTPIPHHLPPHAAAANIQRVREAFRSWQANGEDGSRPSFDRANRCTFSHDIPEYEHHNDQYYVTLQLAAGRGEREWFPLRDGDYVRAFVDRLLDEDSGLDKGRGELLRRGNRYQFHQVVREDIDVLAAPETYIGVDVGLTNLAATGVVRDGDKHGAELWSGGEAAEMRDRFHRKKRQAQADGRYEQLRDDEFRFIEHVCHNVSREVVEWTLDHYRPKIIMEDLTDIRDTFIAREREHTSDERRALHSWPFRKLQDMIHYKATEAGIPVSYLDPSDVRYSSQECNECGYTDDANRDGVHFHCGKCDYQVNADVNAAFNIATRSR